MLLISVPNARRACLWYPLCDRVLRKELDANLLVTDFGLSCILDFPEQPLFHPVGTPGYVAPELVFTLDR
jgi:serine/threonine protein kinase